MSAFSSNACSTVGSSQMLLVRQSLVGLSECCSCCQSAHQLRKNRMLDLRLLDINTLPVGQNLDQLLVALKNHRYGLTAVPVSGKVSYLFVCEHLSELTRQKAITLLVELFPAPLKKWLLSGQKLETDFQQASQILNRLLNPAPLVTAYHYWSDASKNTPRFCVPDISLTDFSPQALAESGLESLYLFRLLQDMQHQDAHRIAPLLLPVSPALLADPTLPDMLNRIRQRATRGVSLTLLLQGAAGETSEQSLLQGAQALMQTGIDFIIDSTLNDEVSVQLRLLSTGLYLPSIGTPVSRVQGEKISWWLAQNKQVLVDALRSDDEFAAAVQAGGTAFLRLP